MFYLDEFNTRARAHINLTLNSLVHCLNVNNFCVFLN